MHQLCNEHKAFNEIHEKLIYRNLSVVFWRLNDTIYDMICNICKSMWHIVALEL